MSGTRAWTQFTRFATIGAMSNVVMYLGYLGLTAASLGHKTAMTFVYVAGTFLTFFLNRTWSFGHVGSSTPVLIRYLVAYLLGYLLNWGILWAAVDWLQFPHQIAQMFAILAVAVLLFTISKFWVFGRLSEG